MRVKYADIARALGVSKATVSLALNGKPGVNEKTRQEIFECRQRLENGVSFQEAGHLGEPAYGYGKQIRIVLFSAGMKNVIGAELDLWTDVEVVFQTYARRRGLSISRIYYDVEKDTPELLEDCNDPEVEGVIIVATELLKKDIPLLERIRKPCVMFDSDLMKAGYPSVLFDNRNGVEMAVDYLVSKGHRDILYLGMSQPMYNYASRKRGFRESLEIRDLPWSEDRVLRTGSTVDEVYDFMKNWLEENPLPDAFLMESYHVSISVMRALREKKIKVPRDISLIGVDELPPYLTGDMKMTAIRVPHTERAYWVMQMLFKEMDDPVDSKPKLYMDCALSEGVTVCEKISCTD